MPEPDEEIEIFALDLFRVDAGGCGTERCVRSAQRCCIAAQADQMLDHLGVRASRQQCRKQRILPGPRMINLVDLTCGRDSLSANGFSGHSAGLFGLSKAGEPWDIVRSEEHTSELQSQSNLVCR